MSGRLKQLEHRLAAQDGKCAYCRRDTFIETDDLSSMATWDEVIPRSRGGRTDRWNRIVACFSCNQRKANRHVHDFMPGWVPEPHWNMDA